MKWKLLVLLSPDAEAGESRKETIRDGRGV